jgi:hypothetical protein
LPAILYDARCTLGIGSQGALGELLGSSARSGQRWERRQASPSERQLRNLAALVFPKDRDLAAEIAAAAGTDLRGLGLGQPDGPPRLTLDAAHAVDLLVCAAADAMNVTPEAVRPALRAAFARARLVGLSVEAVEAALRASNRARVVADVAHSST